MMTTFWFKPKTYGYGATPVTWQGWALVALHLVVLIGCLALITIGHDVILGLFGALAITAVVVWLSMVKTDGKWSWRWGNKD